MIHNAQDLDSIFSNSLNFFNSCMEGSNLCISLLPYIICILFLSSLFLIALGASSISGEIFNDDDHNAIKVETVDDMPKLVSSDGHNNLNDQTGPALNRNDLQNNMFPENSESLLSTNNSTLENSHSSKSQSNGVSSKSDILRYEDDRIDDRIGNRISQIMTSPSTESTRSSSSYSPSTRTALVRNKSASAGSSTGDDSMSTISSTDAPCSDDPLIRQSIVNPAVLFNWRINIPTVGQGVVVKVVRKFGRTTTFLVLFDNGDLKDLPLQRSVKKGTVPFEPVQYMG